MMDDDQPPPVFKSQHMRLPCSDYPKQAQQKSQIRVLAIRETSGRIITNAESSARVMVILKIW